MALGLLARKKGMTTVLNAQGNPVPVTVLVAGPCSVVELCSADKHGYNAVKLAFEERTTKRGVKKCALKEFRCKDVSKFRVGQQISAACFQKGDPVEVRGKSRGRGFQGVIKRWGKHGGPATHGSHFHRSTGSIGQRTWPGRVFKNMKMPGQMGNVYRTIRGLEIVDVDAALHLLFVKGAVPGGTNGLVQVISVAHDFEARCYAQDAAAGESCAPPQSTPVQVVAEEQGA